MSRKRIDGKSGGFTLIEVVVVLGVISLLAGLLFPILTTVREKGRMTACSSNLHQLSLACALYAADNSSFLPPYPSRATQASAGSSTYVEQSQQLISGLLPYTHSNALWTCPSDSSTYDVSERAGGLPVPHLTSYLYRGFGLSTTGIVPMSIDRYATPVAAAAELPPLTPANTPLFYDDISRPCDLAYQSYNHRGQYNTVYLDGHIKSSSERVRANACP